MYATMLKRRLQEVTSNKENPFSSNRYLAERMAEDFEKARISPLKKPKLAPLSPEEARRPKRPRPYVDPWARGLNLPEYDPKRSIKVPRRSEENTNVAMEFLSAKLEKVGLADQSKEENTCKALALYQPNPLQRLTGPNVEVEAPSDLVFSSIPQVTEIVRDRLTLPVPDLSKAIILYPVPENTIREALKKIVSRGTEKEQMMEPEYESSPRIEEVIDEDILDEQEEEGDGMTTDYFPTQFGGDDDDLRIEELGMADEGEEEEEEEEEEADYYGRPARNSSSYWVSTPPEDQERGFFTSPSPSIPCYWHGMTPPPTPLATSFSSSVPFMNQPPAVPSTDMSHFLSLVNGKLMAEQQQQTSTSSASEVTAMPFGIPPVNRYTTGIESIEA